MSDRLSFPFAKINPLWCDRQIKRNRNQLNVETRNFASLHSLSEMFIWLRVGVACACA